MKHTDWAELLHVDKPECWLCYFCMLDSTVTVVVIMLGITATLTKHVHLAWLSNFLKHLMQFEVEVEVWVDSFILQQHAKLCIEETFFSPCYAGVAWSESLNNLNDKGLISVVLDQVSQAVHCGFLSESERSCLSRLPQLNGCLVTVTAMSELLCVQRFTCFFVRHCMTPKARSRSCFALLSPDEYGCHRSD